jgi:hypothetical protein
MCVYSTREELRCFRFQSSNPKRKRGRALPPSLTLRVTFQAPRVQYKSKTFARTLRHQFDFFNLHQKTAKQMRPKYVSWGSESALRTMEGSVEPEHSRSRIMDLCPFRSVPEEPVGRHPPLAKLFGRLLDRLSNFCIQQVLQETCQRCRTFEVEIQFLPTVPQW